jgi:hypothetical protein
MRRRNRRCWAITCPTFPSSRWRSTPASPTRLGTFVQESGASGSSSLPCDVVVAPLLSGCGAFCGSCGCWPAGSGSICAWGRRSPALCSDLGAGKVGAPPRSMSHRRQLHSMTGVYCDSIQSHCAKGPFQLMVVLSSFFGGGSRRRGGRPQWVLEGSWSLHVLLSLFRVLLELWLAQLPLYPTCTCLYSYARLYFLN